MPATDIAPPEPDGQTEGATRTDTIGDNAMAQTHARTAAELTGTKTGRPWGQIAAGGLVVLLVALGVFLLKDTFRSSTPTPTPAPAPAVSTSVATATTAAAEQQAYADTQKVLNAWIANYQSAYATLDASKLDPNLASPDVVAAAKANLDRLGAHGFTAKYYSEIRTVTPSSYTSGKVALSVCALRYVRFFLDGKDVTVDENKNPKPLATTPLWQSAEFTKTDTVWKISTFQLDTEAGAKC